MIQYIENLLQTSTLSPEHLDVSGDGSHFQVIVVSDSFKELSSLKRQQEIYKLLGEKISDGSIHALSIKAFTLDEWQKASKFL